MIRTFIVCFSLVSMTTTLFAEAKLVHAPEYVPGKVIHSEIEMNIDQTLTIAGMDVETANETFMVLEETVTEASSDKAVLNGEFKVMQSNISLPGGQGINFDSGNPNAEIPAGPLADAVKFMKSISGTKWVTTLDEKGYVISQKYPDEFLNTVPEAFRAEVSGEQRKIDQKKMIDRLPGKTVAVGETWERNEEANLGSGQKFYLVQEFTYDGPVEKDGQKLEKISYVTKSVDFEITGGLIPVEVKSSDLKIGSSKASMLYDPIKKVVVETDDTMQVVGSLTLVANGMELPSKLDLTMHMNAKTTSSMK